jgi:DNA-binding response OmpR family regulator
MAKKCVMVVNDTQEILELFREILEKEAGFRVELCSYEPQMLDHVKEIEPDLIISDHVFGEEKIGWQFIQRLRMDRETAHIPVIVCSGAIKELKEIEGYLTQKGIGVLYKPFDIDELLSLVETKMGEKPTGNGTVSENSDKRIEDGDTHTRRKKESK